MGEEIKLSLLVNLFMFLMAKAVKLSWAKAVGNQAMNSPPADRTCSLNPKPCHGTVIMGSSSTPLYTIPPRGVSREGGTI